MSEETSDHGAPPTERLLNALKEAGVDLENPDVIKAIEITSDFHFEVMGQFRSVADRAMKSANRSIDIRDYPPDARTNLGHYLGIGDDRCPRPRNLPAFKTFQSASSSAASLRMKPA